MHNLIEVMKIIEIIEVIDVIELVEIIKIINSNIFSIYYKLRIIYNLINYQLLLNPSLYFEFLHYFH